MHENHRQRMMDRCQKTGFASFADHEVLEMLLYFSKPRCDTNETAHLMLERFGRIDNVFEATPEELMMIDGIGQSSAVLMQLIRESARRYTKAVMQNRKRFSHIREVAEYAHACFVGATSEQLYLFLFNNGMEMIDDMTGPGECVSWNTIWRKSLIFPIICIRVGKIKISLTEKRKIFIVFR